MNILISSCLLGNRVRFDDKIKRYNLSSLDSHNFISTCPEVDGGLKTPRATSEIRPDGRVVNILGDDVTKNFQIGADIALNLCKKYNIKVAILKSKSPSCSNKLIYDGSFSGKIIKGQGVAVKLLEQNGVKVFNENELDEAKKYILMIQKS